MVRYFYDTNALLMLQEKVLGSTPFYISSVTFTELENIKVSAKKDELVKYQARQIIKLLNNNESSFFIVPYKEEYFVPIAGFGYEQTPDTKIIACAYSIFKRGEVDIRFVTEDAGCRAIAKSVGLSVMIPYEDNAEDGYTGYKDVVFSENELSQFYLTMEEPINKYGLLENQYLNIIMGGVIIDQYKWKDNKYHPVPYQKFNSDAFGKVGPKQQDPYQKIALDSLASNQITMLRGAAGSGKSYLAFGYMFSLLEKGKIDKIIVFCNTVATKGSAKLGFYPGSRTEKLLDSQIGNLLESKIGSRIEVERLIDDGLLVLLPMSDIRGYDTTGMNAAVYISEAQNLDVELMKLALQRIGEDSICILDGDSNAQVDLAEYAGVRNGMRRVSKVFRNHDFYGEVTLKNIYRSKIASLAQEM